MISDPLNDLITEKLKAFLTQRNLRPAQFARMSGIPESALHRILHRKTGLSLSTTMSIAKGMGMEPWALLKPDEAVGERLTSQQALNLLSHAVEVISADIDPMLKKIEALEEENRGLKRDLEKLTVAREHEKLEAEIGKAKEIIQSSSGSNKKAGSKASSKYKVRTTSK